MNDNVFRIRGIKKKVITLPYKLVYKTLRQDYYNIMYSYDKTFNTNHAGKHMILYTQNSFSQMLKNFILAEDII